MEINITKINLNPNAGGGNSGGGGSSNTTSFQYYNAGLENFKDKQFDYFWTEAWQHLGSHTYGVDTSMVLVDGGWKNYWQNVYELQPMFDYNGDEITTPYLTGDIISYMNAKNVRFVYDTSDGRTFLKNGDLIFTNDNINETDILNGFGGDLITIKYVSGINGGVFNMICDPSGTNDWYDWFITNPYTQEEYDSVMFPIKPMGYIYLQETSVTKQLNWTDWKGCIISTNFWFNIIDGKLHIKNNAYNYPLYPSDFCLVNNSEEQNIEDFEWVFSDTYVPEIFYKTIHTIKKITIANDSISSLQQMFRDCTELLVINGFNWESASSLKSIEGLCNGCKKLIHFDGTGLDTSNCTDMYNLFSDCNNLKTMDISDWDFSSTRSVSQLIPSNLEELKFGKNLKAKLTADTYYLNVDSIMSIINGLYDFVGNSETATSEQGSLTLYNGINKLSEEQIAVGTAKGWILKR